MTRSTPPRASTGAAARVSSRASADKTSPRRRAGRPKLSLLGAEPWRAAAEYLSSRVLPTPAAPPGDGHPVIIFPGLASDGRALAPLRKHCERLGYKAMDWGRGFNTGPEGDVDTWLHGLAKDVEGLLEGHEAPATLIGWSLGGIYARELAKLQRLPVRQVITIGTPFNGSPSQTHASWVYRVLSGAPARLDPTLRRRLAAAPPVPTTSIYSRSDGVVAWETCCHDETAPSVQDVPVESSHLGMGWNRQVLRVVGERLAQPPGVTGAEAGGELAKRARYAGERL